MTFLAENVHKMIGLADFFLDTSSQMVRSDFCCKHSLDKIVFYRIFFSHPVSIWIKSCSKRQSNCSMSGEKLQETADKVRWLHYAFRHSHGSWFFHLESIFLPLHLSRFHHIASASKQLIGSVLLVHFSINTNQLLVGMIGAIDEVTFELQIKSGLILQ